MKWIIGGLATVAVAVFATPAIAVAQESGPLNSDCGVFAQPGACGAKHAILDLPGGTNQGVHVPCLLCTIGPWYYCHPPDGCAETFVDDSERATYGSILAAANSKNVVELVRLAALLPGFVTFNAERGAVQVYSCARDQVIASLPITAVSMVFGPARVLPDAAVAAQMRSDRTVLLSQPHHDLSWLSIGAFMENVPVWLTPSLKSSRW